MRASLLRYLVCAFFIGITLLGSSDDILGQQAPSPDSYASISWRHIGPEGNRFSSAAGIPGDPATYYVGAASGGVSKTTDGGVHWEDIFDDQPVQSIGAYRIPH